MKISREALTEFKRICKEDLGRSLTDAEALTAAHRVLLLAELMLKADTLKPLASAPRSDSACREQGGL